MTTFTTAKDFKRALNKFAEKTVVKIALEVHGIVLLEVYKKILERTPVLSGRARRNWNVSFNKPNPETTEETSSTKQTGTPIDAEERARAQMVIKNIQFGRLGTTAWISNHLPYIAGLEAGTSTKAPAGIVDGAIQAALEALESKVAGLSA